MNNLIFTLYLNKENQRVLKIERSPRGNNMRESVEIFKSENIDWVVINEDCVNKISGHINIGIAIKRNIDVRISKKIRNRSAEVMIYDDLMLD